MVKQRGYTLIELLLVIALLAVLATTSLVVIRQRAESARVSKTALEMQQVMAAAMAYYADNQGWPMATGHVPSCVLPAHDEAFVKRYLPAQHATSNFGTPYCWGYAHSVQDPLFWVAVGLPDLQMARRVAAQLPNAFISRDPSTALPCDDDALCYVRADVPRPGDADQGMGSSMRVVATGDCQPSDPRYNQQCIDQGFVAGQQHYRVYFDACLSGVPHLVAMPNFFNYSNHTNSYRPLADFAAKQISCHDDGRNKERQYCDVEVRANVCGGSRCTHVPLQGSGTIGFSYVVTCLPEGVSKKAAVRF